MIATLAAAGWLLAAILAARQLGHRRRCCVPALTGDASGEHRIIRRGAVEVRRYGTEVDEVIIDGGAYLHLEVMSQPHAEDPVGDRYAAVSLIAYVTTGTGEERVQVELSSAAPIAVRVLDPEVLACR